MEQQKLKHRSKNKIFICFISGIFFFLLNTLVYAKSITLNFIVDYKTVHFAVKERQALAINQQIPAPLLHFKIGDSVTIHVFNRLKENTAIHWHGLIVPWQMDGVENITQLAIPPSGHFSYHFTLHQSGTYWYHAHAGLQEQQGLYGAMIIDSIKPSYQYNKDYVVMLSDWSNSLPEKIFANLKKDGDYYSSKFPLQPTLTKFFHDYYQAKDPYEKSLIVSDYKIMQQMRMSIYDFSDVAYDAFLLNGHPSSQAWTALVTKNDVVRLRFIGASGSTIFQVKIPDAKMQLIQVDGNDVKPANVDYLMIAPGETYDVLIKINRDLPYIIYAESLDKSGSVVGGLLTKPYQNIFAKHIIPFAEPEPVTREMMKNMMPDVLNQNGISSMNMDHDMDMPGMHTATMKASNILNESYAQNHSMHMPSEPTVIGDKISLSDSNTIQTQGTKYQNLVGAVKTNDLNKKIEGVIRMQLFGYMGRYIWFINGKTESQTHPIMIEAGKRYRIIFTNESMMHHPMHIHGHWFIVRNGHGDFDPLLHTLDVAPGATIVADIDADASGQWLFHCHHLYHMMTGMSRLFQYSTLLEIAKRNIKPQAIIKNQQYTNRPIVREDEVMPIQPSLVEHALGHPEHIYFSNLLEIGEDPFHNVQTINFKGLYGGDYQKLELTSNDIQIKQEKIENAETDLFYWHLLNQFWAIKTGVNYHYRPAHHPYWQPGLGLEGLMPYFIDTDIKMYYYKKSLQFDAELSRDTQITNNFLIKMGIRSKLATRTLQEGDIGHGLNQLRFIIRPYYHIIPGCNLFIEYEHEQTYGALKTIMRADSEPTAANTLSLGISFLF